MRYKKCRHPDCSEKVTKLKNTFCSKSCSVSFNNRGIRRHGKSPSNCENCGKPNTTAANVFCSIKCQKDKQYEEYIRDWIKGSLPGTHGNFLKTSNYVRRWLLEKAGNKCEECGWCKVHPVLKKSPLTVDHIDGDSENNRPENLKILCPNCHSLTPTYGGLNKGKGRSTRRAAYKKFEASLIQRTRN